VYAAVSIQGMSLMPFVLFVAALIVASDAGYRLGRKARAKAGGAVKSEFGAVEGGILALLGLLLGFTMSMAVTRFEVRKQLVLDEANAIGTSYLRTRLLPAPQDTEIARLLREYVDLRLQYAAIRDDPDRLHAVREQTARLQDEFWNRAVSYAGKAPNPLLTGLLIQSLNQVIDLEAARWMAFQNRVPPTVIYVNGIVAVLAAIIVGYAFGSDGRRHLFPTSLLALAIAVVLAVIVDLDLSRKGFIQVSQQPMIDLQHQLQTSQQ
jgi:hypothetical protein